MDAAPPPPFFPNHPTATDVVAAISTFYFWPPRRPDSIELMSSLDCLGGGGGAAVNLPRSKLHRPLHPLDSHSEDCISPPSRSRHSLLFPRRYRLHYGTVRHFYGSGDQPGGRPRDEGSRLIFSFSSLERVSGHPPAPVHPSIHRPLPQSCLFGPRSLTRSTKKCRLV